MLRNYLTSVPYTKFVIIEDCIEERGKPVFDFLLDYHLSKNDTRVHYFIFQENFERTKKSLENKSSIIFHNFISNCCDWKDDSRESLLNSVKSLGNRDVVFIDSLAHVIYQFGLSETYKICNNIKIQTSIAQIICLLHLDLLDKDLRVNKLFKHLCTLSLSMKPNFNTDNRRIKYLYKKIGGKIVKETEEYYFENENLVTQKVQKLDVSKMLENGSAEVDPENLSTFRIGVSEEEKKARDELVLPYLPKEANQTSAGGKIFYEFDEQDDWDEEDPDDDLDI